MSYVSLISKLIAILFIIKLHLHYADINWEEFYKNHVPRSCLPRDYGGDLESVEELSKKNLELWKKHKEYFRYDEELTFGFDEESINEQEEEDSDESCDEGE
jgi:hypothetical protein